MDIGGYLGLEEFMGKESRPDCAEYGKKCACMPYSRQAYQKAVYSELSLRLGIQGVRKRGMSIRVL